MGGNPGGGGGGGESLLSWTKGMNEGDGSAPEAALLDDGDGEPIGRWC